jgi:hypothetical protein
MERENSYRFLHSSIIMTPLDSCRPRPTYGATELEPLTSAVTVRPMVVTC